MSSLWPAGVVKEYIMLSATHVAIIEEHVCEWFPLPRAFAIKLIVNYRRIAGKLHLTACEYMQYLM